MIGTKLTDCSFFHIVPLKILHESHVSVLLEIEKHETPSLSHIMIY